MAAAAAATAAVVLVEERVVEERVAVERAAGEWAVWRAEEARDWAAVADKGLEVTSVAVWWEETAGWATGMEVISVRAVRRVVAAKKEARVATRAAATAEAATVAATAASAEAATEAATAVEVMEAATAVETVEAMEAATEAAMEAAMEAGERATVVGETRSFQRFVSSTRRLLPAYTASSPLAARA